jgi:TolB-like protein/Tfp pilus assembly protein PilF
MRNIVRFDCYEVDLAAGQLCKHGIRISLRDQSFQVLATLLEHPGEVVTREDLRRQLWREEVFVDFDNNLNTAIARLREALGDSADHPRFIETLPKRGYRFLESVSEPPRTPQKGQAKRARMVVLPFVNLSGDPAQEYFSDAMTDEIITALATVAPEQLAVIARTTAMHYKGSHKDVSHIGRELGVEYVVEGGVHRTEEQVGITVQLIQVSDQTHLFAGKFNAELSDIFSLQSDITRQIYTQLDLGPRKDKSDAKSAVLTAARKPTEDLTAYNLYLHGRHHLYTWTPESATKAKQYLERAIARDPEFALAYDCLGELYWSLGFYGFMPPKEACSVGLCYALRAVEIDNNLAETHALLGRYRKQVDFNWPEAQREMRRALELNPTSPVVRLRYATSYLMARGHLAEAAAELEGVLEYDPMNLNVRCWLAVLHYLGCNYDCALEQLRLVLEVDPKYSLGHLVLGQTRCMEHRFEEAIPVFRRAVELYGGAPMVLGWLGLALAQSGNASEARSLLRDLHAIASGGYVPRTSFAWVHFGLGEMDEAFVWMDRAIEARDHMMTPIKTYPFMDPIRSDPRFAALLRKMNLEDGRNESSREGTESPK